jgi:hypothetical protein
MEECKMIKVNEVKAGDKFVDMIGREWTCTSVQSESNSKAFVDVDCVMIAKDDAEALIKWFTDYISEHELNNCKCKDAESLFGFDAGIAFERLIDHLNGDRYDLPPYNGVYNRIEEK